MSSQTAIVLLCEESIDRSTVEKAKMKGLNFKREVLPLNFKF